MSEKRVPFEITSGTPSIVVTLGSQVTRAARAGMKDSTSAPTETFPTIKQGWASLRSSREARGARGT